MNGKNVISHVKNETTYNIPLVIEENVISSGITLVSLWHTLADESYRVHWPQDKRKPLIANSWIAVYTLQGSGKITLRDNSEIMLNGNCVIFLKPTDIKSYCCQGLVWEQYWMEFIPTGAMEIPLNQSAIIYGGESFKHELAEVSRLLASNEGMENNLAVACLVKMIYQWICLIRQNGTKERQLILIEKLLAAIHTNLQQRWTVADMAAHLPCSEQYLRRLFMRYTGQSPKEYYLNARLDLAISLLRQESHSVSQVADMLNFFDNFHFSKAFKQKFGFSPSHITRAQQSGTGHP
ncbi:AraC family transcriptional regulator [Salmonella enterica subsp. enterica serovar Choleraesuis]|nr:AraC family transcriptional regulator [Salmonella enterica subsp. enterica serovar Choleraesuis]